MSLTFASGLIQPPEELDRIAEDYQRVCQEITEAVADRKMIRHLVLRRDLIEILYGEAPGGVTDAGL